MSDGLLRNRTHAGYCCDLILARTQHGSPMQAIERIHCYEAAGTSVRLTRRREGATIGRSAGREPDSSLADTHRRKVRGFRGHGVHRH